MLQSFLFQKILNFTYSLTKPPDGQWGSLQSDMSWTGMVGMLNRGDIDIGKLTIVLYIHLNCYLVQNNCCCLIMILFQKTKQIKVLSCVHNLQFHTCHICRLRTLLYYSLTLKYLCKSNEFLLT